MSTNPDLTIAPPSWKGGPVRLVRKYAAWTVLVTVLVMTGAVAAAYLTTPVYVSAARVVIEPRVTANTTPLEPDMGTEKQVAQSGVVLVTAAEELGVDVAALDSGLEVTVSPDTRVLEFVYSHPNATSAQRRAHEVSVAYVDYRNSDATSGTTRPTLRATLVTEAGVSDRPNSRPIAIYAGVGALVGLTLSALTALVRDRLDDSLRGSDDVERYAGRPVLATVPFSRTRDLTAAPSEQAIVFDANTPAVAAIRQLRTKVQALAGRKGGATVLVASPSHGDGRTTIGLNLAAALANSGATVVLVDDSVRFDGVEPIRQLVTDTVVSGLKLVRAGVPRLERTVMPDQAKLKRQLADLRAQADYVVLDTGPVSTNSDAMALAGIADVVLVVAEQRRTTRGALADTVRELRSCEGDPAGVVVNVASKRRRPISPEQDPYAGLVEVPDLPYANSTQIFRTSSSGV